VHGLGEVAHHQVLAGRPQRGTQHRRPRQDPHQQPGRRHPRREAVVEVGEAAHHHGTGQHHGQPAGHPTAGRVELLHHFLETGFVIGVVVVCHVVLVHLGRL
jgi:hypothetical protein